jgi:hypothetical protein
MRRIAPAEDLEILEGVTAVVCPRCRYSFRSKPGVRNKPGGRCECGGWICPACLAARGSTMELTKASLPYARSSELVRLGSLALTREAEVIDTERKRT